MVLISSSVDNDLRLGSGCLPGDSYLEAARVTPLGTGGFRVPSCPCRRFAWQHRLPLSEWRSSCFNNGRTRSNDEGCASADTDLLIVGDTAAVPDGDDEEHHEAVLVVCCVDGDNVEVLFLAERARPIVSSSSSERNGPKITASSAREPGKWWWDIERNIYKGIS